MRRQPRRSWFWTTATQAFLILAPIPWLAVSSADNASAGRAFAQARAASFAAAPTDLTATLSNPGDTGEAPPNLPPHTPLRPPKPVMPPNDDEVASATGRSTAERSIREARTADSAAPTGLRAELVTPVNVILRWRDNAQDEEGYVLEASKDQSKGFVVLAIFPPDTTQFEVPDRLPDHATVYYRVRAYFSKASNRAQQSTGVGNGRP